MNYLPREDQIRKCTRCGFCVPECPVFEQFKWESSSPRGHIAILKGLLYGYLHPEHIDRKEYQENLELCLGCKLCQPACPVGVKIADLIARAKHQVGRRRGFSIGSQITANYGLLGRVASRVPRINRLLRLKPLRLTMERITGIDSRRILPTFTDRHFLKWFESCSKGGKVGSGEQGKIAYFAGCNVLYSEPKLGEALVKIFQSLGFQVAVPEQRCCGIAALNKGMIKQARKSARFNIESLLGWIEEGYDVVTTCPSGNLALREEYGNFFDLEGVDELARHTYYVSEYLLRVLRETPLQIDLADLPQGVFYHEPCHLKVAQQSSGSSVQLLQMVPGLRIENVDAGCCGLGGTYGLSREKFELSLQIGSRLFQRIEESPVDRISTDCGACKLQIEQGANLSGRVVEHPLLILWEALRKGMDKDLGGRKVEKGRYGVRRATKTHAGR